MDQLRTRGTIVRFMSKLRQPKFKLFLNVVLICLIISTLIVPWKTYVVSQNTNVVVTQSLTSTRVETSGTNIEMQDQGDFIKNIGKLSNALTLLCFVLSALAIAFLLVIENYGIQPSFVYKKYMLLSIPVMLFVVLMTLLMNRPYSPEWTRDGIGLEYFDLGPGFYLNITAQLLSLFLLYFNL